MGPNKLLFLSALLLVACLEWQVDALSCNVCQSNGAACISTNSYHLCYGGPVPNTAQTFRCGDGLICTDRPNICFQDNGATASCGDTSSCGRCNTNLVFACTSRTTFAFCFGATRPTNVVGRCPTGMVCDASTQSICVSQLQPTSIVCHLETPPVTTAARVITTTSEAQEDEEAEAAIYDGANADYY